jgi:hypothetical protein
LRVTDTGIGIPESELQHIGKRFHRITTEGGRSHEGTGIGKRLSLSLLNCLGSITSSHLSFSFLSLSRYIFKLLSSPLPKLTALQPQPHTRCAHALTAGLALVYELVHLHGGTTMVESQLGKGTPLSVFFSPFYPFTPCSPPYGSWLSVHPSVCDVSLSTTTNTHHLDIALSGGRYGPQQRNSKFQSQSIK